MKNPRRAIAALAVIGALAWPASSAATGATSPRSAAPSGTTAVVSANADVRQELEQLAHVRDGGAVRVVRVGDPLHDLLQDPQFLQNVHVLQDFLHNNDAGVLSGSDVAITSVVAIDVRPRGDVVVYSR